MKCKGCGSNLSIQDEVCGSCGLENPQYKKHREEMRRFRKEYDSTREADLRKSRHMGGVTQRVTIIAVLVTLILISWVLAANAWNIGYFIRERQVAGEWEKHGEMLHTLEESGEYFALAAYYDEHSLYQCEQLEEYNAVYQACRNYAYCYEYLMQLQNEDDYTPREDTIGYFCDSLDYLYENMVQEEYDPPEWYEGLHKATLEQITYEIRVLLMAYAKIPAEVAGQFPELSTGRRLVEIERGLGIYED